LQKKDLKIALKGALNVLKGRHPRADRLTSMTVDRDDVAIIERYLRQPQNWGDESPIVAFESAFANRQEVDFAYSFMGGRVALSAIISALELKEGDEVLVPAYTCIVVPNAFWYRNIRVHFYDIETTSYGPCGNSLEHKLKKHPNVKAVVIHHLFGLMAKDYEKLVGLCRARNIFVIEDCAHSVGLKFKGRAVGNLGDAAFFSFEHSKIISTFNGGMAVTNDEVIGAKLLAFQQAAEFPSFERGRSLLYSFLYDYYTTKAPFSWLTQGVIAKKYRQWLLSSTTQEEMDRQRPSYYGQRMIAPLAEVGLNQLNKLEHYKNMRLKRASVWDDWCTKTGFEPPYIVPGSEPVYLRYPVMVSTDMKKNRAWAKSLNVEIGLWFVSYIHPVSFELDDCPNALEAVTRCINFPTLSFKDF